MSFKPKPLLGRRINPYHPLAQGLVGCWLLNEGGGDKIFDLSGYGNVGTFVNNPTWVPDGLEVTEDGDEHVTLGRSSILQPSEITLVVGAIKTADIAANNTGLLRTPQETQNTGGILAIHSDEKARFFIMNLADNQWAICESDNIVPLGSEHQYIGTCDGSDVFLHIDGVLQADTESVSAIKWGTVNQDAAVGRYNVQTPDAIITYAFYYNRALTPRQITSLHAEPYAMFEPVFDPVLFGYVVVDGVAPTKSWQVRHRILLMLGYEDL